MHIFGLVLLVILSGCARPALKSADQSMRLAVRPPEPPLEANLMSLAEDIEGNVRRLRERADGSLNFGPVRISAGEYARALEGLAESARRDPSGEDLRRRLREDFEIHEVYGDERWGEVLVTGYFEPVIEGAKKPSARFRQPVYAVPRDLVEVDLSSFGQAREAGHAGALLRGRLLNDGAGVPRVVAFPDRAAIVTSGLPGVGVLAYADPIDLFILEIQGSGVIRLREGGEMVVGYGAQNGHPYVPIGRFLLDRIPKDKLSLQAIEAHLRALPEDEARELMNRNPSFIFFRPLERTGQTFFGAPVSAGRTIATDPALFPKGALAMLEYDEPTFLSEHDAAPSGWRRNARLVLDHDTGGAIRGPGRVDLFWGRGPRAKQAAGVSRNKGRLYYFVPRRGK